MLAHLFQTFCVLSHLFQQVLLFLIVRIRALFKLLEARSILLRFQPLRCPSSSVRQSRDSRGASISRANATDAGKNTRAIPIARVIVTVVASAHRIA